MNVLVSIVGLGLLVLIHEAGHFFTALAVRMRPRKFYVFFPPPVLKTTRKGIEYGIGAIPLGGYVKIPGMHRPAAGNRGPNTNRTCRRVRSAQMGHGVPAAREYSLPTRSNSICASHTSSRSTSPARTARSNRRRSRR